MLGSNTERALQIIDKIIQATADINIDVAAYRITSTLISGSITGSTSEGYSTDDSHIHHAGNLNVSNLTSREDPHEATIENISSLKSIKSEYDSFMSKIQLIDKNIYVKNTEMHNSIGSPYTEMYRLQNIMNEIISFNIKCTYMGEYVVQVANVVSLINRALQLAIDAKWAVITYSDYLERGYNYVQGQDPNTTR